MKIENNNYIPVRNFSKNPITNDQGESAKKIVENINRVQEEFYKMIDLCDREIAINNKQIGLLRQVIEKCDEIIAVRKAEEDYMAEIMKKHEAKYGYYSLLDDQKNNDKPIVGSIDTEDPFLEFKDYLKNNFLKNESSNFIGDAIRTVRQYTKSVMLHTADFVLSNGDHKEAIELYDLVLSYKFEHEPKKQLDNFCMPLEEELRQASKLYVSLQPMIDRLNLDENIRIDLFSSAIAAHTQGKFSLSKIEVLDMLNKQFYYA